MTKRKRIAYAEGQCFMLPLRGGGFARGVVARMDGRGRVLGYFFGPNLSSETDAWVTGDLRAQNTVLVRMFGDLGLLKGEWRVIGNVVPWRRDEWPLPPFCYTYDDTGEFVLRYYDDQTLDFSCEEKVPEEVAKRYPRDGLSGYGAIEIHLAKLLK